mmetsp:Transcript_842/g.3273  ORF Transcript_842/g.3273 Transcript_842/m.3273 type:complete len:204 (-) Transcript_842:9-620(-)
MRSCRSCSPTSRRARACGPPMRQSTRPPRRAMPPLHASQPLPQAPRLPRRWSGLLAPRQGAGTGPSWRRGRAGPMPCAPAWGSGSPRPRSRSTAARMAATPSRSGRATPPPGQSSLPSLQRRQGRQSSIGSCQRERHRPMLRRPAATRRRPTTTTAGAGARRRALPPTQPGQAPSRALGRREQAAAALPAARDRPAGAPSPRR